MGKNMMTEDLNEFYLKLRSKVNRTVTDVELKYKAKIAHEILQLKKEKNALILAHNYMEPVLFSSIPDFVGDSLELSRKAASADKDIIVFCGVKFMAETSKLLNPDRLVLLPSLEAGCSLAASISADNVRTLKNRYPGVPVVTYINTYADVKAESDICCTSGNASAVVESLHTDTIIFIPDEYLAKNVARETGKHIIVPVFSGEKDESTEIERVHLKNSFIIWNGRCEVHEKYTRQDVTNVRTEFPGVVVLAHPECSPEVVEAADFSGGTTAMAKYVERTNAPYYLLLTECSMGDNISASNPDKNILRLCSVRCPHMNQITLENTLYSLQNNCYQIDIPQAVAARARQAIIKMLAIS